MKVRPGRVSGEPHSGRRRTFRLALSLATAAALLFAFSAQSSAAESPSVKVNLTGSGFGEVTSSLTENFGTEPRIECSNAPGNIKLVCEGTPEGEEAEEGFFTTTLEPHPAAGSVFAGWTITKGYDGGFCSGLGQGAGHTCPIFNEEPFIEVEWEVSAEFVSSGPVFHELTVSVTGPGRVDAKEPPAPGSGHIAACKSASGECMAKYEEGQTVTLVATPEGTGSEFSGWTGCTPVGGHPQECEVTMSASKSVQASFIQKRTLTIEVSGEGEVSGTGITCKEGSLPAECAEEFAEATQVPLAATPKSGSHFKGWTTVVGTESGTCTGTTTSCQTAGLTEAVTLKATFEPNSRGGNIVIGTATAAECSNGGITVEVEGEPSTKHAICNGAPGAPGTPGTPGAPGAPGTTGERGEIGFPGPQGPPGATGAAGATGATGSQGSQGPQGAQGPQGPAGKVTVTCKVTNSKKVTCNVKTANASASSLRWTLRQGGALVGHGRTSARRLERVLEGLGHGRYVLLVNGRRTLIRIA